MTVTIVWKDGTANSVFTSVTEFSVTGDIVKITGVDPAGVSGTTYKHWSDCKSILTVPAAG